MDIKEIINYSQNKIEADDLTKQVRKQIKETAWEKQNQREGFSESFKPLISQFEKPVDPKKKNLFTQNQEILRNQLDLTEGINKNRLALKYALEQNQKALTEGLKENQKALTEGLKVQPQAITEGLENFGGKDYNNVSNPDPSSPSPSNPTSLLSDDDDDDKEEDVDDKEDNENQPSVKLFIDNVFDDQDLKVLKQYKYGEPADILKKDEEELEKLRIDVNKKIRSVNGKNKKETKTDKDIVFLNKYIQAKIT